MLTSSDRYGPDARAALADPDYLAAWRLHLQGRALDWTDAQQAAVTRVRETTGDPGPGLPAPLGGPR